MPLPDRTFVTELAELGVFERRDRAFVQQSVREMSEAFEHMKWLEQLCALHVRRRSEPRWTITLRPPVLQPDGQVFMGLNKRRKLVRRNFEYEDKERPIMIRKWPIMIRKGPNPDAMDALWRYCIWPSEILARSVARAPWMVWVQRGGVGVGSRATVEL